MSESISKKTISEVESKAIKGVSWLALFKMVSQFFSWVVTIVVARILVPGDYGLMAMSTVITGYAEMFSELGLGAAIIQKPVVKSEDTYSTFWFAMMIAFLLALFCFIAAPITAKLFQEPRVVPLTQAVSVLFLLSGLQIVPLNLLKKELQFKTLGLIEMTTTIISCMGMLVIAWKGGGVWTLLGGRIIRGVARCIMIYYYVDWRPKLHFRFKEAVSYLQFGIAVAIGQSFFYAFEKSDRFFAGRAWPAKTLGYYTFALQLAQIPTEKIVTLINQVSFSAFSKLQFDQERFNSFYLNSVKLTATLVLPIFVGGFLVGESLILVLLNEKWLPIVFLFRFLCLSQITTALNAINNFVHNARGKPKLGIFINAVLTMTMSLSYYFTVKYGKLDTIVIPWLTTYTLVCLSWILFTINRIGIKPFEYMKNIMHPICATLIMACVILVMRYLLGVVLMRSIPIVDVCVSVLLGGTVYFTYMWTFNRDTIKKISEIRKT